MPRYHEVRMTGFFFSIKRGFPFPKRPIKYVNGCQGDFGTVRECIFRLLIRIICIRAQVLLVSVLENQI